jgi:hypothetical protein
VNFFDAGGLTSEHRAESLVRKFVVEDINKFIKAGLLLQKVRSRRLGGFFLKVRCMRP